MSGKYKELRDTLSQLFEGKGVLRRDNLLRLGRARVAIDVSVLLREYTSTFCRQGSLPVEQHVRQFLARLSAREIQPLIVLQEFGPVRGETCVRAWGTVLLCTWRLNRKKHDLFCISTYKSRREEMVRVRKMRELLFQSHIETLESQLSARIVTLLHCLGVDFIVAPGPKETQIAQLYECGLVDAVAGDPMLFGFCRAAHVIKKFDFESGQFSFYSFEYLRSSQGVSCRAQLKYVAVLMEVDPCRKREERETDVFADLAFTKMLKAKRL